jgi:hypothetical protein
MKRKNSREGVMGRVTPHDTIMGFGVKMGVTYSPQGEGRCQGVSTPYKGGVTPSFDTFLPLSFLRPGEGFFPKLTPSDTFAAFFPRRGAV